MKRAILILAVLAACGSKKSGDDKSAKSDKGDKPASGDTASTKPAAKPIDAAPPAPPDAAPLAPVAPDKITIEDCTMDGAPVNSDSFSDAAGDIALAPDGSLYVVVNKGTEVRHYTVAADPACKLTLDPAFTLTGTDIGDVEVDDQGRLLVAANNAITRYVAGKPELACTFDWTPHHFLVESGDKLLVNTFMDDLVEVGIAAPECAKTPWTPKIEVHQLNSMNKVGDHLALVFTAAADPSSKYGAVTFGFDGTVLQTLDKGEETNDPKLVCTSAGVIACGTGLCLADANCRTLHVYGPDGKLIGNHDLEHYPWVTGFAGPRDGVGYLAITMEDDKSVYHPVIQRVHGL
jgi:hypothetical protein